MSDQSQIDVGQLVAAGEGERLELKTGLPDVEATARSIAGLANSGGGHLVVGVDPDSQELLGLSDPADVEQTLENAAKLVAPGVELLETRSAGSAAHPLIIADIRSTAGHPVADPDGAFVRRGPTGNRVPLDASELAKVVAHPADPNEMLKLFVAMNQAMVRLQETLDQEHKEAAVERKQAKQSRSFKWRALDWLIAGVIGAILGVIASGLVG